MAVAELNKRLRVNFKLWTFIIIIITMVKIMMNTIVVKIFGDDISYDEDIGDENDADDKGFCVH